MTSIQAVAILPGVAKGMILAADTPLSFWGGYDPTTGEIIDCRHPLAGHNASGRILVLPSGRGSCSGSGVLLEAIRTGTAPAAIITSLIDPIIGLGAILGDEMYATYPVMLMVGDAVRSQLRTGDWLSVSEEGRLTIAARECKARIAST